MANKVLVFSDLHIHSHKGRTDRLHDCLDTLRWIFETAEAKKVKHILFLGDLFHERFKIDVLNYLRTFEVFREYVATKPPYDVYLLIGNHDMYHKERWDVTAVKPFTVLPNVKIVDRPTTLRLCGDNPVDFMPYTENPIAELAELKKNRNQGGDSIPMKLLLGHMAVHGAKTNTFYGVSSDVIVEYDNEMVPVDASIFEDWDMTILGHYHGAQQISKKAEYIGSPLQLAFGEVFQQKHIMILDLDTLKKEYVVNDFSPVHLIVTPKDIADENYKLENNFVRVVTQPGTSGTEILDLKREIVKQKVASLDFKKVEKDVEDEKIALEDAKSILQDVNDMCKSYVDSQPIQEMKLDRTKLLDFGKLICAETVT